MYLPVDNLLMTYTPWLLLVGLTLPALGFLTFLRAAFDPSFGEYKAPGYTKELGELTKQSYEMYRPLFGEATNQLLSLLQTGGTGALTPSIGRAMEGARVAGSRSLQDLNEQLSLQGITGTERAALRGQAQRDINFNISQIPLQIVLPLLQSIFGSTLGQPIANLQAATSISGQRTAGAIQELAGNQALQQKFADLLNSFAVAGASGGVG